METMREKIEATVAFVGIGDALRELAEAHDTMALRLAALERAEVERTAGGYWSCTGCAATPDASGAWRWEGDKWAHRCSGNPPQAGHEPARWFGRGAPTGPDGLPMTVDARGVPFIRPELVAKAAAWRDAQPGDIIVPDPRIAELEARIRELEAKNHAQGVEWRAAEDRCREANERVRAAEARIAALTAERDAAVKRAERLVSSVEFAAEYIDPECANATYERVAEAYLRKHHRMAPGKSDPLTTHDLTDEERAEQQRAWSSFWNKEWRVEMAAQLRAALDGAHVGASEK